MTIVPWRSDFLIQFMVFHRELRLPSVSTRSQTSYYSLHVFIYTWTKACMKKYIFCSKWIERFLHDALEITGYWKVT